jgi:predicted nuclease of restriction endonuclease-like (RecB) superfamily
MSNTPVSLTQTPDGYAEWLAELKTRIHTAQQRATLAVNRELVPLYWQIGRDILSRQTRQGWGAKVIDRLAHDLRVVFLDMKGFSPRNLKYMRAFAEAWPETEFVQEVLAQLPWYHPTIGLLLCKNKMVAEYALRDNTRPLGIAEYKLMKSLPEPLQTSMPTIEQIERELEGGDE